MELTETKYTEINLISYKLHPTIQKIFNLETDSFTPTTKSYYCPICRSQLVSGAFGYYCFDYCFICPKKFTLSLISSSLYLTTISCSFEINKSYDVYVYVNYEANETTLRSNQILSNKITIDTTFLPDEITQELVKTLWLYR